MTLNVMEGVLGDVSNTGVGVLPDFSNLRLDFSDEELNHCRFTSPVLSNTGHTRTERHLYRNIEESWCRVDWVGKGTLAHFHQSLSLGFYSFDGSRLGKLEFHLGFGKRKVRTSMGMRLDILVQVALESVEPQVVKTHNVGTAIIQETRVVTNNN